MGRYEEAEPFAIEALSMREKVLGKEHPEYTQSLNNLASLYFSMGRYEAAEVLWLQTKAIRDKVLGREHPKYASSLHNLAVFYNEIGDYRKAELLYLEAKAIQEKTISKEHPEYASSLHNLANLYAGMESYDKAEPLYLEASAIYKKTLGTEHPDYATTLYSLANLYMDMGNYEKALALHREALSIREKVLGKDSPEYSASLNNLAVVLGEMGKTKEAEELYLAAISLKEKTTGKDANYAGDIINLANLYRAERQFAKAETLFLEAKDIFENKVSQLEHPFYMTCLEGLAKLYFESGDYAKSGQFHAKALALREAVLGKDNLACALSHADMALLYWKTGDHITAEHHFSRGSHIVKSVYSKAARHQSEKEMFAYVRKFEIYLKQSLSFASANEKATPGFVGECFDNALFYRGFLLNVSTQIRKQAMENKGLDENFNLLKSYHRRLAAALAGPLADRDSAAISELEAQANALEKDLARTVAGFGEAIRQVGWQEVQAALQPGEAAVEFIHFDYFKPEDTDSVLYAAMLLKSGMEQPLFIPLFEEKTLERLLPPPGKNRSEFVSQLYQNQALTTPIWSPIESHLQGVKTVYYAPSGLLHRLNLAALPTATGEVLSTKYDLVQLGSSRQLVSAAAHADATTAAVLFGGIQYEMDSTAIPASDPGAVALRGLSFSQADSTLRGGSWKYLKNSERETSNVAAILQQAGIPVTTLKGYEATEEAFKKIGGNGASPRILHLSTHGYFFPDSSHPGSPVTPSFGGGRGEAVFKTSSHPMIRSGLILAGANHAWQTGKPLGKREDGVLTAYEISQLDLRNTELVVLSACETGLGDIRGNEGVYGLQRAFKIAGAKNLLMSLWQVPDFQTQELMTLFYQKWLLEKMTVRNALHAAQVEMRERFINPYQWAGFVLVE